MTYVNAIKYLNSLPRGEMNTERAHKIRELLSSNDDKVKTIHMLGAQGKNSCQVMLASIISTSGLSVGTFAPSHAIDPREAVTVNGKVVSYETFASTVGEIKNAYDLNAELGIPSADEVLCLLATLVFEKEVCDVAIYEKGLKKSDAVNMTSTPILSVISSMGDMSPDELELSDSLRRGTTETITSPQHKNTYNAISEACARIGSRLTLAIYSELEINKINLFKTSFSYSGNEYSIRSFSPYQTVNAITVIEAANALARLGLPITQEHIKGGIEKATFPYKCEAISLEPTIIICSIDSEEHLPPLASSIAQVAEFIKGDIFVAIEDECSAYSDKVIPTLEAYGVIVKDARLIPRALTPSKLSKEIKELTAPLLSDETMSSALILVSKRDFSPKLAENVKRVLGRI